MINNAYWEFTQTEIANEVYFEELLELCIYGRQSHLAKGIHEESCAYEDGMYQSLKIRQLCKQVHYQCLKRNTSASKSIYMVQR